MPMLMPLTPDDELAAAREAMRVARVRMIKAIRNARRAGMTYRAIGDVLGVAHETVRRLEREHVD
jgi:DNA-binding XRE family transcriptional regulator